MPSGELFLFLFRSLFRFTRQHRNTLTQNLSGCNLFIRASYRERVGAKMNTGYRHSTIKQCEYCGKNFSTKYPHSKTCSNKCRSAKHRSDKKGNGKTWHDVGGEFSAMANDIRNVSQSAYDAICEVLGQYGANAARLSIGATWYALTDCLQKVDEGKL